MPSPADAAQSPLGLDRVLFADRVFAARRQGRTDREIASALNLSHGQVRRIVRSYGRVRRDQMVQLSEMAATAPVGGC